jgi:hypothetical protein
MTSACTILCPAINYAKVLEAIRLTSDGEISLDGTNEKWGRITVMLPSKQVTLTSLVREMPGDKFSKLVLSMHNFFRTIETPAASNKRYVLSRIADVQMMIGVVAEPQFLEDDSRFDILWGVAEWNSALIFNGEAILDLQGRRILDCNGEFDVLV